MNKIMIILYFMSWFDITLVKQMSKSLIRTSRNQDIKFVLILRYLFFLLYILSTTGSFKLSFVKVQNVKNASSGT